MTSLRFWQRWLFVSSVVLVVHGIWWTVAGSLEPFGVYDGMVARTLAGADELPEATRLVYRFLVGLLGALDAAFFVLFAFVVHYPFANREPWAHVALTAALAGWFVLDSGVSIAVGAWFNVAFVNLPCLFLLGVPLWATRRAFHVRA